MSILQLIFNSRTAVLELVSVLRLCGMANWILFAIRFSFILFHTFEKRLLLTVVYFRSTVPKADYLINHLIFLVLKRFKFTVVELLFGNVIPSLTLQVIHTASRFLLLNFSNRDGLSWALFFEMDWAGPYSVFCLACFLFSFRLCFIVMCVEHGAFLIYHVVNRDN